MIHVRQHIPDFVQGSPYFVEGSPPNECDVATTAELIALPWVKTWEEIPGFVRFSIDRQEPGRTFLMAEMKESWWVVAFLSIGPLDLPDWVMPKS